MVTYKLILDQRRAKSNGKYPINIRVTHARKSCNIYTGISIKQSDWDINSSLLSKCCPGYKELNKSLTNKFLNVQKCILDLDDSGSFSLTKLLNKVNEKPKYNGQITFLKFANDLILELKETNRVGNAIVYNTGVQRLINFTGNKKLTFEEIDYVLLDNFIKGLQKQSIKTNSIGNYLRSIRAIYNKAIKSKIVNRSFYYSPF